MVRPLISVLLQREGGRTEILWGSASCIVIFTISFNTPWQKLGEAKPCLPCPPPQTQNCILKSKNNLIIAN